MSVEHLAQPLTPLQPTTAHVRSEPRTVGWDELKAATTLLVVFHHTAITYGALGGWFYKEVQPQPTGAGLLLIILCTVDQAWFMGLFFLLAGRFTPAALQRKGRWPYLRDRLLRLGVPWLVFGFVIGPATVALAATANGHSFTDTLALLWRRGQFEPGPLWFAQALLIFATVAALWPRWKAGTPTAFPSNRSQLLGALGCAASAFCLRLLWPVGSEVAHMQLGYFASYVLLFVIGCMAASRGWFEHLPEERVRLWRRVAWWALPALLPLALLSDQYSVFAGNPNGGWTVPAVMYALWEPFVAWGILLGLLMHFRSTTAPSSWRKALARRAYSIFVIHPPVVVAVALSWRGVAAPLLLKFAVTGTVACLICYGAAGVLLRVPGVRRVL